MTRRLISNRRPGAQPLSAQTIHPAWCTCSDCCQDQRRELRLDLMIIGMGAAAATIVGAASWIGNF